MSAHITVSGVIGRRRGLMVLSTILAVIAAALGLAPYVAVYAITVAVFSDDPAGPTVLTIAAITAAAIVGRSVAGAVSGHIAHVAAYGVLADLRMELVAKLRRMPLGGVLARPSGELKKVLADDVEQLEEALAHGIPDMAAAIAVPVTTTVLLCVVDWRLGAIALGALVALVVLSGVGMALAQKSNVVFLERITELNNAVMAFLQGIRVIRGYLRPDAGYYQVKSGLVNAYEDQRKMYRGPLVWLVSAMSALSGLAVAALIPAAGLGFISGGVSAATLILFLMIGLGYLSPLMGAVGVLATIMTRVQFAGKSVDELLAAPELGASGSVELGVGAPEITFENVTFGYRREPVEEVMHENDAAAVSEIGTARAILADFNLHIEAGSTVAIVGPTGSGKSTLGRLIARFWDVDSGAIRIGGVDVAQVDRQSLASRIAFVQQEEYIFAASLLENIRVAAPGASDEQVIAAGVAAQLEEVAQGLPHGWFSELSAGGGGLSGGQRQRVSIARALLKSSTVIILDEATASLDSDTEDATLRAVHELTRGRTTVAIAHRLSTITDADRIVMLADGAIVADGGHAHLLATSDCYRELWRDYEDAEGWTLGTAQETPVAEVNSAAVLSTSRTQGDTSAGAAASDEWDRAAREIVTPGISKMGFVRQWLTLLGRGKRDLLRSGLPKLVVEGLFRGIPILAVYLVVVAVIDQLTGHGAVRATVVWWCTALVVGGMVIRLLALVASNRTVWAVAARSKTDVQLSIIERLRRVPLGYFDRAEPARTASTLSNDVIMIDFQNIPAMVVSAIVQPVYLGIALLILDWRLALCALAGIPLFLLATVVSDRAYHRAFAEVHHARSQVNATLLEQVRGAAVIRANPRTVLGERYRDGVETLRAASVAMSVRALPATAVGAVAVELGLVLVIVVGAARYESGGVSAAVLLLFLMLSLVMYQPIQQLNELAGYRRNQQQIAAKVAEIWDEPILSEPDLPQQIPDGTALDIEFDSVGFSYLRQADSDPVTDTAARPDGASTDHDHRVLSEVSFRAPAGEITALVGPSGAGKSTVANLVARLWDTDSGSVRIGGVDVRSLGSDAVTRLVTTVFQGSYLFPDTVAYNMRIGRPDATDTQIWAALEAAQCADVVRRLPGGLGTRLNDGGTDLSGGERQRLCIARALLKDSPVIVLDEAVAAVDPSTEVAIHAALASLMAGRTVVVIAHRLTTVANVGHVVALESGRVVATGAPAHVLEAGSPAGR